MDRYLTFEGEQPIWLDDFNFMQDAVKDSLCKVAQTIMRSDEKTCILHGCEITYDHRAAAWTDGIVILDGELLPVKAGTIKWTDPDRDIMLYFHIVESTDPSGGRTFKNGERHNCYQRRYATITDEHGEFYIDEIPTLELLAKEESHIIFSKRGTDYNGDVKLHHTFGGGWYISGKVSRASNPAAKLTTIVPDTDVTHLKGLHNGVTYVLMPYVRSADGIVNILTVAIIIEPKDNGAILNVSFVDEVDLARGEGQFYCRLID